MAKTLVAYYSYSGNTKTVAEKIKQLIDADLFEIKPSLDYPADYNAVVSQAQKEKNQGYKPQLKENIDISNYDTIFIGTPVWWYTFATPVRTFLTENNFQGKTIIPFCTHGGGGASSTYLDMKKTAQNANFKEGYTSYNDSAKLSEIENWIKTQYK